MAAGSRSASCALSSSSSAPASSASPAGMAVAWLVSSRIRGDSRLARIRRVASRPSILGIRTSISIDVGLQTLDLGDRLLAVGRFRHDSTSGKCSQVRLHEAPKSGRVIDEQHAPLSFRFHGTQLRAGGRLPAIGALPEERRKNPLYDPRPSPRPCPGYRLDCAVGLRSLSLARAAAGVCPSRAQTPFSGGSQISTRRASVAAERTARGTDTHRPRRLDNGASLRS